MLLANFILFQLAWFACVAGAAYGQPWLGVMVTLLTAGWHLYQSKRAKPELLLMFAVLLIGACFDQAMLLLQLVSYQQHGWSASLVPVWIMALWLAFATTLNLSLAWMQGRYLMAVLFGAAGGPLAYFGAQNIGAVTLPDSTSYLVLSIGWGVITPLLLRLANYMNGYKTEQIS